MQKLFTISVEKGKNGYFVSDVKELPGCHTQAKTLDELMKRTSSVISLYLKAKNNKIVK